MVLGRPPMFQNAEEVFNNGMAFIVWCKDNPFIVEEASVSAGKVLRYNVEKVRMPTVEGWAASLGCAVRTVYNMRQHQDLEVREAVQRIFTEINRRQQEAAAAGLIVPVVGIRAAGLSDKVRNENVNMDAPPPEPVDPLDVLNLVHPDAPFEDQICEHPLLFTQRQLDAGVQYPVKK